MVHTCYNTSEYPLSAMRALSTFDSHSQQSSVQGSSLHMHFSPSASTCNPSTCARSTKCTIQSTHDCANFKRCCRMSISHSRSASSNLRCFNSLLLAASRVRADAHLWGNRDARTRFFAARSAALMGPSACCRRNCCTYREPPVDTLSIVITACCPVSLGAVLSCTICDGRCGVAGACPGCGSAIHCIDHSCASARPPMQLE